MTANMTSKLFEPLQVGNIKLRNRVAMAPLTRRRADSAHVPLPFVKEYYAQRAVVPGTLLVTEATFISPRGSGSPEVPGIWTQEQITAWREVTAAVHARGSYIYLQLWCLGRTAKAEVLQQEFGLDVIGAGDIRISEDRSTPRPLREEEIWEVIEEYAQAAKNAVDGAGFDGVEIHGANGYMVDQFIQDISNNRTDSWGGTIENRARFAFEVSKAVVNAIGKERTGIRLSPYGKASGMGMDNPVPQFSYVVQILKELGLAYIHLVESRINGSLDAADTGSLRPFIDIWDDQSPVLIAGGYTPESARIATDEVYKDKNVVIVFGRYFISTPDLVYRLQKGLNLSMYDRSTFYKQGSPDGYTDYPFSAEFQAEFPALLAKA
jgi:NADPH2 dehydrogenase